MSTNLKNFSKNLQVIRTKFGNKELKKILDMAVLINWKQNPRAICQQYRDLVQPQCNSYVWLVGSNPTYFIQYQIDSYAILKIYDKNVIVWKPKYLQYPSMVPLSQFPQIPKNNMKGLTIDIEENSGDVSDVLCQKLKTYIQKFYCNNFYSLKQSQFQTNLVTQLKHYVSRSSKVSYWNCIIDSHADIDVTSRKSLYLRVKIHGFKEKYSKDLIIFSHQGVRSSFFKGKKIQIVSFLAMVMIFMAVISCSGDETEGICSYRDQMLIGGAAVMMGLMGVRVATRAKNKRNIEKKLKQN